MNREEAIEVYKGLINAKIKEAFEFFTPELKESEDEMIRKDIINLIYWLKANPRLCSQYYKDRYDDILAYLEKQKESADYANKEYWRGYREGKQEILDKYAGLEKKKEQTEELSIHLNGLMQEYVKSGKDEEEQEHRLKCYQLFWDALSDSEFFEHKEQKPILKFKVGDKIHLIDGTSPNYEDDCITISEIGTVNYIGEFKEGYVPIKEQNKWELVKERKPEEYTLQSSWATSNHQQSEWSEKDEDMLSFFDEVLGYVYDNNPRRFRKSMLDAKMWLKSLRPQPKKEWSKDYQEEYLRTRFAFYTYKDEDDVLYLSNVFVEEASRNKGFGKQILKAAENVAETIGASCIRVKVKQDSPANTWYRKHGYGHVTFEDGYDWLEKRLEYLKPEHKWSKEDEANLDYLIDYCNSQENGQHPILVTAIARKISLWLYRLKSGEITIKRQANEGWSNDDEERFDSVCSVLRSKLDEGNWKPLIDLLLRLKTAYCYQRTYNEKDDKTIHLACEFIRHHARKNDSIDGIDCSELVERLKFLRP